MTIFGLGGSQSNTRIALAAAMVGCVALIGALLVADDDSGDLRFETAADSPQVAAAADAGEEVPETAPEVASQGLSYDFNPSIFVEPVATEDETDETDLEDDAEADEEDTEDELADADDEDDADTDGDESETEDDASTSASTSTTTSSTTASTADGSSSSTTTEVPSSTTTTAPATTTTTAASTTTTAACSGARWSSVMSEEFNGSSVDGGRWAVYNSGGNAGYGLRRPSAMSVSGGILTITASMVDGTLVSGGMEHLHNQTYGRYEFRVRTDVDTSEATSGVVLTWPQSNAHPRDGENNIYETLATPGDRHEFYTFIHEPFGTVHDQDYTVHPVSSASWRTMVMEWTPNWIKLYRDGSLVKTIDETGADLIPDVPHHAAIQLDAWKHSVGGPVTMQVDYIRVWSYDGGC